MPELTVLYDGNCNLCRSGTERVRGRDRQQRIELLDLHDPSAPQRFPQIERGEAMKWMLAVDASGRVYRGADAWARIGLLLPGWRLLAWILLLPGIHWLAARIYTWIARNRYRWNRAACQDGSCKVHSPRLASRR